MSSGGLCYAEVRENGRTVLSEQDISRFYIPVYNIVLMSITQRFGDLSYYAQRVLNGNLVLDFIGT